ncbi:DM13 domain-containing protein [uncultured Winogradskyella sp.]|uniref:T9SS type A sorting domain-containing protein n=1 Tax=uncultured Winogradskyella sp. TaxID=395353 RepID=UPI0026153FAC|nr:DM13 domain-containing protein [uncultured Winogradskyella sp.]
MKRKLLLVTILIATTNQFINSQCERSGSFIQSDPQYSISGDAKITFTTSGDKDVVFEPNFATVQGADLRVYLSKTDDIVAAGSDAIQISGQLENDAGGFGGPGTSPITGMMTFSIPSNTELDDFDFIVIQCISINERWGHVALGSNTGVDCSSLSIDENNLETSVRFYPNPAKENLIMANNNLLNMNIKVFDVLGKEVLFLKNEGVRNQNISLSSLKTGVYLVQITADNQTITKRLVKQ